jgi:hypothetical protein
MHSVDDVLRFHWSNLCIVGIDGYTAIADEVKGRIGVAMELVAKVEYGVFTKLGDSTAVDEVDRHRH